MMLPILAIWTVYDHPTDYPDKFVARLFEVTADGPVATDSIIIAPDVDTIRNILCFDLHLTCLTRQLDDDPKIVENWL